jgi:SAM-dependent methyltransferase
MKKTVNSDTTFSKSENSKIIRSWSTSYFSKELDLYTFKPACNYFYRCVSGDEEGIAEENWFENWLIKTYLKDKIPVAECLTLCCGHGERDRRLSKMGFFENCLGLDISPEAIESCRKNAFIEKLDNLKYSIANLNTEKLNRNTYDLIYVGGGMHHILNLEHLVDEIYQSLKPGGLLVCDEYIGPAYNNLSNRHREIINGAIHLIPHSLRYANEDNFIPNYWKSSTLKNIIYVLTKLRSFNFEKYEVSLMWPLYKQRLFIFGKRLFNLMSRNHRNTQKWKFGQVFDICPESIKKGDPSEGIRSDEIIPIIKQKFKSTNVHYYNGSLISYILDKKFFLNYNPERKDHCDLFDQLVNLEKYYIHNNEIPPILGIIVSQKEH